MTTSRSSCRMNVGFVAGGSESGMEPIDMHAHAKNRVAHTANYGLRRDCHSPRARDHVSFASGMCPSDPGLIPSVGVPRGRLKRQPGGTC